VELESEECEGNWEVNRSWWVLDEVEFREGV
jgi:hypothetical protein